MYIKHTHIHTDLSHAHTKTFILVLKWDRSGLNIFKNFEFMFVQFVLPKYKENLKRGSLQGAELLAW